MKTKQRIIVSIGWGVWVIYILWGAFCLIWTENLPDFTSKVLLSFLIIGLITIIVGINLSKATE